MCESCDRWVAARRNPFWVPKKLNTSVKTLGGVLRQDLGPLRVRIKK